MSPAPRSPLDGTDRLVIDGTNLLHRIGAGTGAAAPPAAIIGRLRAAIPAAVSIDLVFDGVGHGVKGRLAQAMFVRYSGRHSADDMILGLTAEGAQAPDGGAAAAARVLVVTNDRELRARLQLRGVRSMPLLWLLNRLDMPRLSSAAAGNRRPTIGIGSPSAAIVPEPDADRSGWKPGRGATRKVGTPRKVARHRRHPTHGA